MLGFPLAAIFAMVLIQGPDLDRHQFPQASTRVEVAMSEYVIDLKMTDDRIVCLMASGEVLILDRETGEQVGRIAAERPPAAAVAISPDNRWIATGGVREMAPSSTAGFPFHNFDGPLNSGTGGPSEAQLARIKASETLKRDRNYDAGHWTGFHTSNNSRAKVARGGKVAVHKLDGGRPPAERADFPQPIAALAFNGAYLIAVERGSSVTVLDARDLSLLGYCEGRDFGPTARFPHQTIVFGGSTAREARIARLADGPEDRINVAFYDPLLSRPTMLDRGEASASPWAIAMTSDAGKLATCGPGGSLTLWEPKTHRAGRAIRAAEAGRAHCQFIAFGPTDDELIVTDTSGLLQIWDLNAGRSTFAATCPARDIRAGAARGDRLTLVSGGYRRHGKSIEPLVIETHRLNP